MTTAVTEYTKTEAALADLAQRYRAVVFDVTTREGMATAIKGRAELRGYRVSLEKTRVEIKGPALERCRLIDAEAKRITAELVALEDPIDDQIKKEEARKEAEKAEAERREQERIARIQAAIEEIRQPLLDLVGAGSERVARWITLTEKLEIGEQFGEFKDAATIARDVTLAKLRELHTAALAHEAEQKRIVEERAELERRQAEQAERERQESLRVEAENRKRAEEQAEARRRIEEQERLSRLKIEADERAAREQREEQDRVARIAREAEERKASEARAAEEAKHRAEEDRLRSERAELDRKAREIEERERADRHEVEARERVERDRLDAERREVERQRLEDMDFRNLCATLKERFGHRRDAARIMKAIDAYLKTETAEAA